MGNDSTSVNYGHNIMNVLKCPFEG